MMMNPVTRRYVTTRSGTVHLAECGNGPAVMLFHQTPRSWAEYRDVLPILGKSFRAIAMDTRGFGDSDPLPAAHQNIEGWSAAALDLADALELDRFAVVGHHTGAYVALETAASAPQRVTALVASAMSYVDADRRAHHAGRRVVDEVERRPDGTHLTELWTRRQPNYPAKGLDLLERYVLDALKAGPMAAEGHRIVNRYQMETRVGLVRCPSLILAPMLDGHAYPSAGRVTEAIPGAVRKDIPGAMVPFPDQLPELFAAEVADFLFQALSTPLQK